MSHAITAALNTSPQPVYLSVQCVPIFKNKARVGSRCGKRGEKRPIGQSQGSESDNGQNVTPATSIEDQPTFLVPLRIPGMLHLQCANEFC